MAAPPYSMEEAQRQLWRWLTAAGTNDPGVTAPALNSGGGSSAAPDYFRVQDGTTTNLLVVDSSGRITSIIASGPTGANALAIQGTAAAGAAVLGNPLQVGGSDGTNTRTLSTDTSGRLNVVQAFSFLNIAGNATTTVKSGAGTFHAFVINTRGVTSAAVVYDSLTATGTKVATIDTTLSTTSFVYNASFATGLTVVTTGGTAADLTVIYR